MNDAKEFKKKARLFKNEIKKLTTLTSKLSGVDAYAVTQLQSSFRSFIYSYDTWLLKQNLSTAMDVVSIEWRFLSAIDLFNHLRNSLGRDTHELRMFVIDCTAYARRVTCNL